MPEDSRWERTVLELASEIFQLKTSLATLAQQNEQMAKLLNSLRDVLEEKGMISELDLISAIELAEIEAIAASLPEVNRLSDLIDDEPSNH